MRSSSFVNAPSIEAGGPEGGGTGELEVEKRRGLGRSMCGREKARRRGREHRRVLLIIIVNI